jgi:hypothetical protein
LTELSGGASAAAGASGAGVSAEPQADKIMLASTSALSRANRVFFILKSSPFYMQTRNIRDCRTMRCNEGIFESFGTTQTLLKYFSVLSTSSNPGIFLI